jgi:hypothetical protein
MEDKTKSGAEGKPAGKRAAVHKVKDNSLKTILDDHELFAEFLRDFIRIDALSEVEPADIEDVSERFIPLFDENRDSDTVKKIRLKGNRPLFVIALVEHESKVNFRSCFKMLQYVTLILSDCEKEANREKPGVIYTKRFKYPPVLPVVFYDGKGPWTAALSLPDRTELREVFGRYIPNFEYELVSLNEYDEGDLVKFGDALSLVMLVDRIRKPGDLSALSKLPDDYIEQLALNIPPHLNKLLADVIAAMLRRMNIPAPEIGEITEKIYTRRIHEMFTGIEGYDVQETRRVAKREGILEGKRIGISEGISKGKSIGISEGKRQGILEGKQQGVSEGKRQGILEGKQQGISEGKRQGEYASRLEIARNMKREQMDASRIAALTGLTEDEINSL